MHDEDDDAKAKAVFSENSRAKNQKMAWIQKQSTFDHKIAIYISDLIDFDNLNPHLPEKPKSKAFSPFPLIFLNILFYSFVKIWDCVVKFQLFIKQQNFGLVQTESVSRRQDKSD